MNYFNKANIILVCVLTMIVAASLLILSVEAVIVPVAYNSGWVAKTVAKINHTDDIRVLDTGGAASVEADDSPHYVNVSLDVKQLREGEYVKAYVISDRRTVEDAECPLDEDYTGGPLYCEVPLKYKYLPKSTYTVYPALVRDDGEATATPFTVKIDWRGYVGRFWSASAYLIAFAAIAGVFSLAVVTILILTAKKTSHDLQYPGEYSLKSIFRPFSGTTNAQQKYWGLISSSTFWMVEIAGVMALLAYIAVSSDSLKSLEAAFAFIIGGLFSFPIPIIIVAAFWYADYKEREPLQIMMSLFLWGGLACVFSLGINDLTTVFFDIFGVGVLAAPIIAPLVEELFKGIGLVIFSLHHEFDDMVDGIVYGVTIGMGFTFIEDWIYLVNNPAGGNMTAWLIIFVFRLMFSLNHGIFTACTGAVIGYLKQNGKEWAPYGLFIGMIPAMLLHFSHNLITVSSSLLGPIGGLMAITILPLLELAGASAIIILMAYGVYKAKAKDGPLNDGHSAI